MPPTSSAVLDDIPAAGQATPDPGESWTRRQRLRLVLVLGALIAVGPLTIDLYLPALPTITADLDTSAAAVQATLTGTLLGLSLGQLVIGPLSDVLGRRRPLMAGLGVHLVASLLSVAANDVLVLTGLRFVQGLGAAAGSVIAMAIVRDLYTGMSAARLLSRLLLVMGLAPILAPTMGSAILTVTTWPGIFAVLALVAAVLIGVAMVALPETLPPQRRARGGVRPTLLTYRMLLRDRSFVGLIMVMGLTMAMLFAYISGSSFVLQQQYGLTEREFGLAFGINSLGLILASQLNPVLLRRYSPQQVLSAALVIAMTASLALMATAASGLGGLVGISVPLWFTLFSCGLAFPNAPALALARHGAHAGTAAALLGSVQFGTGALAAPVVGLLGSSAPAMAAVMVVCSMAAVTVFVTVVMPSTRRAARLATAAQI